MAFKIPEYTERVAAGSAGAAPRIDPSGAAVYDVGPSISAAANEAGRAFNAYEQSVKETAESDSLAALAELQMQAERDFVQAREQAEPGAKRFTPSFMKGYSSAVDSKTAGMDQATAERFRERAKRLEVQLQSQALAFEAQERQRHRVANFETAADAAASTLFSTDADQRSDAHTAAMSEFMTSLNGIELEPGQKLAIAKAAERKLSFAAVQGDLRDRPERVQDWLTAQPGTGYYAKLRNVESGGRNIGSETSSAYGVYQFTEGTWAELIKKHPKLGLSEQDRYNPLAQEFAIRAFTEDNAAILKKMGYAATNANLYMMHFLGEGGGPRFLRAVKNHANEDARSFVSAEAVNANPGIFKPGRTVEEVYALFGKKFGMHAEHDTDSGAPGYYDRLTFEHRNQLYSRAETEMRKRRTNATAAFKQRIDNAVAEVAANGSATDIPSEGEFLAAIGNLEKADIAYGEFKAAYAGAEAAYKMQSLPPDRVAEFVEGQRPQPGDPFFAEKAAAFVKIQNAAAKLGEEWQNDPAQSVIRRFPEAKQLLADAFGEQAEFEAGTGKQAAAVDQWTALVRANGSDRLLPNALRDSMKAKLSKVPVDNQEASGLWREFSRQKALWRDDWPTVLRELGDGDARVIGSIAEEPALMLLASRDKTLSDLTKPLPEGTGLLITSELS